MTKEEFNSDSIDYSTGSVLGLGIVSPIPKLAIDEPNIVATFNGHALMPKFKGAFGTAISYIELLSRVAKESVTHKACLDLLYKYAFRNLLDVRYDITPDFVFESQREVSVSDKTKFVNAARDLGLRFPQIKGLSELIDSAYTVHGDAYLYCRAERVAKRWNITFNHVKNENFAYYYDEESRDELGNISTAIWTKSWDYDYVAKTKNRIGVSIIGSPYVRWTEKKGEKNVFETIFHWKNADNSDLYGDLSIAPIRYDLYNEAKQNETIAKIEQSILTAQFIYASQFPPYGAVYEGMTPEESQKRALKEEKMQLSKLATAKGKEPSELLLMKYHEGDNPQLFSLQVNRDTDWYEYVGRIARKNIQQFHGISDTINGWEQTKRGIGDDAVLDELIKFVTFTVTPKQVALEGFWSFILTTIGELVNEPILIDTTIEFERGIEEKLLKYAQRSDDPADI